MEACAYGLCGALQQSGTTPGSNIHRLRLTSSSGLGVGGVSGVGNAHLLGGGVGPRPTPGGAPRARPVSRMQQQQPHTSPPIACAQPTPFVGRGAMGSHLRVVRPGEPLRLRSQGFARSSPPGAWPPHRAFRLCVLARPPGTQPPLPSGGWRASFWRKPLKRVQTPQHPRCGCGSWTF